MKCACCESTGFTKIELSDIFYVSGDANLRVSKDLEFFSCNNCGYIIFFDKFLINKKNAFKEIHDYFDPKINALYFRRNEILKGHSIGEENELNQIQDEIKSMETQKQLSIEVMEKDFSSRKFK